MTLDGARGLRLLADENVQGELVHALRGDGLDVAYVAEGSCGITDEDVLHLALADRRVLLTEDKDFRELVFRCQWPPKLTPLWPTKLTHLEVASGHE